MDKMVPGSIAKIFTENDTSTPLVLQTHQSKAMNDDVNRIRLLLNDGKFSINSIFKPNDLQEKIENFQKCCYLSISNYSISVVSKKIFLLINQCEVVAQGEKPTTSFESIDKYLKENPDLNKFPIDLTKQENTTPEPSSLNINTNANPSSTTAKTLALNPNNQNNTKAARTPTPTLTSTLASSHSSHKSQVPPEFQGLTTIDQISPYLSRWSIKARVSYKSDEKRWNKNGNEGKLFSVHFMDETGEIKATAFNQAADKFYDLLQENSVYYITKVQIRSAKKQFSTLPNENELFLDKDSIITPAPDADDVPKVQYNFVKLDQIEGLENNTVIDVLGIVKNVEEKREIVAKASGKPYDRRDITIVDESQTAINVGLWNKMARDFSLDPGTPIAIRGCKINDFNGKQLSLTPSATIQANPDIPEAFKLKGWYDNQGSSENFKTLKSTTTNSTSLTSKESILERITVAQVHETKLGYNEKPDYFTIKASVSYIRPDNFSYPACSTQGCQKKVIQQGDGTWRCEKCSINHPEPLHRYILASSVVDETGQLWLNLFNEQAEQLIGKDAKSLLELKESSDETAFKNYLTDNVLFKEFIFRVRAKVDTYQGVDRPRFQVLSISKINPSTESDALIDIFNKLNL